MTVAPLTFDVLNTTFFCAETAREHYFRKIDEMPDCQAPCCCMGKYQHDIMPIDCNQMAVQCIAQANTYSFA